MILQQIYSRNFTRIARVLYEILQKKRFGRFFPDTLYIVFAADYGGDNDSYGSIVKCVKVNVLLGLSTRKVLTSRFWPTLAGKILAILFTMVVCD